MAALKLEDVLYLEVSLTVQDPNSNIYKNMITEFIRLGQGLFEQGNTEAACQLIELVLNSSCEKEADRQRLYEVVDNWWVIRDIAQMLVEAQPNNMARKALLSEAKAKCSEFHHFEEEAKIALRQKLWQADQQKRFTEPVCPQPPTVRLLGRIMLEVGYVNQEQLETTLSLQNMLARLGSPKPLGKMFLEGGYLTPGQLDRVLQVQQLEQTYQVAA